MSWLGIGALILGILAVPLSWSQNPALESTVAAKLAGAGENKAVTNAAEKAADAKPEIKPPEPKNEPKPETSGDVNATKYTYDPTNLREPFDPESQKPTAKPGIDIAPAPVTPVETQGPEVISGILENYDLEELRLSAIVWDAHPPKALLVDPKRVHHTLRLRDRIGKHQGVVVAIREGEVVVMEKVLEEGKEQKTFKIMELR